MKIRFQADNDFNGIIRRATLRLNPAIDFQSAPALGLHLGTPDDVVLELAADWLVLFWEASEAEEHVNQIINLP